MTRGCICPRAARRWGSDGSCSGCGNRVLESQLTPVLLQILTGGTGLTLWRNTRGFDAERKIRYGVADGGADFLGLHAPSGRFVAIEFKTARGRQSPEQVAFEALVGRLGGIYAICRNENDARAVLAQLGGAQ